MKTTISPEMERSRIAGVSNSGPHGAFRVVHPETGRTLQIIASDGRECVAEGLALPVWEHVSVSTAYGVPTYAEMVWVKKQFWEPHEWAIEFHAAEKDHINIHPNVLHLWSPVEDAFPVPPKECV